MKRAVLFLFLYMTTMLGLAGYLVYTRQQDMVYRLETDRAYKAAKIQLDAQGIHCDGT